MNPISGTVSKAGIPRLIDSTLDKELFEYEIKLTERAGHASQLATEAKEQHADIVVKTLKVNFLLAGSLGYGIGHPALRFGQRTGTPSPIANEPEEEHRDHQCLRDTRPGLRSDQ